MQATLSAWGSANSGLSAAVWRLNGAGDPTQVAAHRPEVARIPASTEKLVTSVGALLTMGPGFQYETRLFQGPGARRTGRLLRGALYVKGYGDPTLATRAYARSQQSGAGGNFGRLFLALARSGIRVVKGPIAADEAFFDSRRLGSQWRSYYAAYSAPLSALSVNRNSGGTPPLPAAVSARAALRGVGIRQTGGVTTARTPSNAHPVAVVRSPRLTRILRLMNPSSDNYTAEMLMKGVGAYGRSVGTSAAGAAHTAGLLRQLGVLGPHDRIVDGSGLSRANRLSAATLTRLLAAAEANPPWGRPLVKSLPRGGEGTLRRRFLGSARNRVRAKTGSLNGVTSLAGRVVSRRGQRYAFALLFETTDFTGARVVQDRVVRLLAAGREDVRGAATADR